jgi:hypothetical protein
VSSLIDIIPARISPIITAQVHVPTAGTRVRLADPLPGGGGINYGVTVSALHTNTGLIFVGGKTVDSTNGYQIGPSEAVTIATPSISDVFIDAAVSGDGVTFLGT